MSAPQAAVSNASAGKKTNVEVTGTNGQYTARVLSSNASGIASSSSSALGETFTTPGGGIIGNGNSGGRRKRTHRAHRSHKHKRSHKRTQRKQRKHKHTRTRR